MGDKFFDFVHLIPNVSVRLIELSIVGDDLMMDGDESSTYCRENAGCFVILQP